MVHFNTVTQHVTFPGHNGDELEAYLARPTDPGTYPGIVVIHHLPGWDAWTREVVRKFAEQGFNVVSPHLYSRLRPGTEDEINAKARTTLGQDDPEAMGDVAGAARYLKSQPNSNGKAGCIGFCSGGRQAYLAASQVDELDAAVDCWGGAVIPDQRWPQDERHPVSPFEATKDIHMPLLGIFGNDDVFPTPDEVNKLEAALKENGKEYEFYRYDGAPHGFWAYDRPSYRVEATNDSFKKAVEFYRKHLE